MDYNKILRDLQAKQDELMSMLTPKERETIDAVKTKMSIAKSKEELDSIKELELEKIKNGYKNSTNSN